VREGVRVGGTVGVACGTPIGKLHANPLRMSMTSTPSRRTRTDRLMALL
jgi:hypothetical protein